MPISQKSTSSTDTTSKISKKPNVGAGVDVEEEILEELYVVYLQRRLLAQYTHKRMRQELDRQTDSATTFFLQKELIEKKEFEARFHSLRKIEKQLAQLDRLKPLEENLDSMLELILINNVEEAVQNFENKLGDVGDTLRTENSKASSRSPAQTINSSSLEEAYQELKKCSQIKNSAVNVIENLSTNLETLQNLEDGCGGEEKQLNETVIQLVSLKASQKLLDTTQS